VISKTGTWARLSEGNKRDAARRTRGMRIVRSVMPGEALSTDHVDRYR
jgi:hypothetical protein